jgi:hypothetical protein
MIHEEQQVGDSRGSDHRGVPKKKQNIRGESGAQQVQLSRTLAKKFDERHPRS